MTRLLAPMMPHLAEELWQGLGHKILLAETAWPDADPALIVDETVTVAVQVNGKLRATLSLPRDLADEAAEQSALADENVQRAMAGKSAAQGDRRAQPDHQCGGLARVSHREMRAGQLSLLPGCWHSAPAAGSRFMAGWDSDRRQCRPAARHRPYPAHRRPHRAKSL